MRRSNPLVGTALFKNLPNKGPAWCCFMPNCKGVLGRAIPEHGPLPESVQLPEKYALHKRQGIYAPSDRAESRNLDKSRRQRLQGLITEYEQEGEIRAAQDLKENLRERKSYYGRIISLAETRYIQCPSCGNIGKIEKGHLPFTASNWPTALMPPDDSSEPDPFEE